jgi:hypothetical protein
VDAVVVPTPDRGSRAPRLTTSTTMTDATMAVATTKTERLRTVSFDPA